MVRTEASAEFGSSPRGRGKPDGFSPPMIAARLIPAWAGKTGCRSRRWRRSAAHPRVGGENVIGTFVAGFKTGSSPRGRGKRRVPHRLILREGLIPAWAGKTEACAALDRVERGSSPRGRGKPITGDRCEPGDGLIPAWAGKTAPPHHRGCCHGAHPRVGGENYGLSSILEENRGSSPRGRGKPPRASLTCQGSGLIPAWAGKTLRPLLFTLSLPAHPRVGGENVAPATRRACHVGSSPRGRGKRRAPAAAHSAGGLIPAWAGKTRSLIR